MSDKKETEIVEVTLYRQDRNIAHIGVKAMSNGDKIGRTTREINSILCEGIGVILKSIEDAAGREAMANEVGK